MKREPRQYRDLDWSEQAACAGTSPNIFFPPDTEQRKLSFGYYQQAKAICHACPVTNECLTYGLKEPFGVWGGLTPRERWGLLFRENPRTASTIRFDMRTELGFQNEANYPWDEGIAT